MVSDGIHEQLSGGTRHHVTALRLLDVGCADGQFLARAAALGHTVTGVDFSPEDIEASRGKGFEAYVADLRPSQRTRRRQTAL